MKKVLFLCAAAFALCHANSLEDTVKALDNNDLAKAYEICKTFCDKNDAEGCVMLAFMYETGLGVEQNMGKAAELYAKACKLGHELGCEAEKNFKNLK